MPAKESEILYENGNHWVLKMRMGYATMRCGITHSTSLCVFPLTDDGLSLAIAYCDYQDKRKDV